MRVSLKKRWENLALWIVFALSCVAWSSIGNAASVKTAGGDVRLAQAEDYLNAPQTNGDSELGVLRVRELKLQPVLPDSASELGTLRLRDLEVQLPQPNGSSELGTLRVREQGNLELGSLRVRQLKLQPSLEAQFPQFQPTAHLLAHIGYFQTNNIFSGVDPVNGGLVSSGLTLWAAPKLGPKINLVTAIDGSLIRYIEQSEVNYNQLRFRAGIRQQLTRRMYGEVGWNNQQLFRARNGDRFLDEHSIRLALYRQDQFTSKLRLDSLYEFRLSFADPDSRSRIVNSLSLYLSYYIQRNIRVGIDYQFGLSDFTRREREDQYHRLLGRLIYSVSRNSQLSVQGGLSLGDSSDSNISFDGFFFSVSYVVELGKF